MRYLESIPVGYDVSLAFVVLLTALLTIYMGLRCIRRRMHVVTVLAFVMQLFMLTSGILAVLEKTMTIPYYEIMLIVFGVMLPGGFLVFDYYDMKKRIKANNTDVPLIEKIEKKSTVNWTYNEYVSTAEEWKNEVVASIVTDSLKIEDKQLKTNVTQQISQVHRLIDEKAYDKALDIYLILSGLINDNPFIAYNTGWLCYKNSLFEEAVKYYKKTLSLVGGESQNNGKKKNKNKKNKDFEGNINDAVEALRPAVHFGYGLSLYALGRYELAIEQFNLAQKKAGDLRESEINIARCHIAVGDLEQASEHIKLALKLREDTRLRFMLAKLCFERNLEMECKYHLETIVASDAEFTEAWELLGKIYRKSGAWKEVLEAYKRLTQLIPENADYHYHLGVAQRELGKTDEAISSFKFAVDLLPEHSRAYYSLASIYDAQGKTENAIECLNKSLEGNEKLEMAYNLLAEIYISNDRINDAIRVYEKAVRVHPESYIVHYNLGITLMMMRRYDEAIRIFNKAHRLTDDDPSLYYNWASAAIGLKNYSEAARLYKEGLKFKPDDDEMLFGLARVSALSGDVEATLGFLARAFEINPNLKLRAKSSHDFAAFRTYPAFMELTRLPLIEERKNA